MTISNGNMPKWTLSNLYKSDDCQEFKDDLQLAKDVMARILQSKGELASYDDKQLLLVIKDYAALSDIMWQIGSYAYLRFAKNTADSQAFYLDVKEKLYAISSDIAIFSKELNTLGDSKLNNFLSINTDLRLRQSWIQDARDFETYQLYDKLEPLITPDKLVEETSIPILIAQVIVWIIGIGFLFY